MKAAVSTDASDPIQRSATMQDVARLAGVSPMTVSNAFRNPEKVSPATREKIAAAAKMLRYIPNMVAGSLASGRSRLIGAIVPSLANSSFSGLLRGLSEYADRHGYELLVSVAGSPERELVAIRTFMGRRADGIVLIGTDRLPAARRMLQEAGVAVVEAWAERAMVDMSVGCSDFEVGAAMTRALVERGYRNIAFIGSEEKLARFEARKAGFRSVLAEAGLPSDLLVNVPGSLDMSCGVRALEQMDQMGRPVDAVFCVTDVVGVGVIFECMRRGWAVPERLAVAGYGNYQVAAQLPTGLSTIDSRSRDIGYAAAALIAEKVEKGVVSATHVDVGFDLILRNSF